LLELAVGRTLGDILHDHPGEVIDPNEGNKIPGQRRDEQAKPQSRAAMICVATIALKRDGAGLGWRKRLLPPWWISSAVEATHMTDIKRA